MTRTQTPAQKLASRLYSVDAAVERQMRENGQPQPVCYAVYLALNGIRSAEEKMTSAASWIRGDLDRMAQAIATGTATYGAGLGRNAAEFDAACALRDAHAASLAALLGEDGYAAWNTARTAARTEGADDSWDDTKAALAAQTER